MLDNILDNLNNFFKSILNFFAVKKPPLLNNDLESCCILLSDDTNTISE